MLIVKNGVFLISIAVIALSCSLGVRSAAASYATTEENRKPATALDEMSDDELI